MEDKDEYDSYWYGTSSYPPFHRMPIEFVGAGVAHVSPVSINQGGPAVSARDHSLAYQVDSRLV